MIRAEELMLGDYLTFPDVQNDSNCPKLKVVAINEVDVYVSVDGDPDADLCDPKELAGISLTPEILEKNGMREFEHRNPWQGENLIKKWYHKSGDYYVSLYQVGREQSYTFGDGFRPTRICNIHFVHELQHALRLCGIDKTIEL